MVISTHSYSCCFFHQTDLTGASLKGETALLGTDVYVRSKFKAKTWVCAVQTSTGAQLARLVWQMPGSRATGRLTTSELPQITESTLYNALHCFVRHFFSQSSVAQDSFQQNRLTESSINPKPVVNYFSGMFKRTRGVSPDWITIQSIYQFKDV